MQAFVESYGLPYEGFRSLMTSTNSLVAGSAALALYLQQNGVDPGFVPGDMDIWAEDTRDMIDSHGVFRQRCHNLQFTLFLVRNGYNVSAKFEEKQGEYEPLHQIRHVLSFVNREGKQIQLILLQQKELRTYIKSYFDLSPCVTWWNAAEDTFETEFPRTTLAKQMHLHPAIEAGEREVARIEKYEARGFTLTEFPCAAMTVADSLDRVEELGEEMAFDVFAYDDVKAVDHLKASSYHILVRIGEQYYAYHRNALYDYLQGRVHRLAHIGDYTTLPHKQAVMYPLVSFLPYSDYSIFHLVFAYTFQDCAFYSAECFTTAQWAAKEPGLILDPPAEPELIPEPAIRLPLYHPDVYWME